MIEFVAVVIGSYLMGSIPFALLLGKLRGVDIRQHGSGNVGTTNVLRTAGAGVGVVALVCDVLKGVVAVLIARYTIGTPAGEMAAGLAAVVGHDWSVFIRFRGGKGVATSEGALFVMVPIAAAVSLVVFVLVTALSRYASLASLLGAAIGGVLVGILLATDVVEGMEYLIFTAVVMVLIVVRHRDNISNLLSGTEGKLGKKVEGSPTP